MTHENQPAPRSVSQVRLVEDDYFYYMHGRLGLKSDGSFTDEKRHWIPFGRLDAVRLTDKDVKPYGAAMEGVFVGTEHNEYLMSATRTRAEMDQLKTYSFDGARRTGKYPFGRADRDDQFHGSRVRVLAELKGDADWEGTVQCALNNGRLLSVIRDGKDFSTRVPGERIEVIERIENGVKTITEDDLLPVKFLSKDGVSRVDYGVYNRRRGEWDRVRSDGNGGFSEPVGNGTPQENSNAIASVKRYIKECALEAITEFNLHGWTITPEVYKAAGMVGDREPEQAGRIITYPSPE